MATDAPRTGLFSFPDPVDETSARLVAAGVVLHATVAIATGWTWLVVAIACLGCKVFAVLMRLGVIPERVCERCVATRA